MATILDRLVTVLGFDYDDEAYKKFQGRAQNVQQTLRSVSRGVGIAGAGLTGAGAVVGKTILDFEQAFNELNSIYLDAPAAELEKLRRQAVDLGSSTSKSARDAATAQYELASSGLAVNDVLKTTPEVLNLAIAGNADLATSAKLVSGVIAAYGKDASEAGHITDVWAKLVGVANTNLSQIAPTLRPILGLAAPLGIGIEQMAAQFAVLRTEAQLAPEQAGTSLRNVLAILSEDPSKQVREGIQALGLTWEQLNEKVVSGDLTGAMQMLRDAGATTPDLLNIFGREAGVGAAALVNFAPKIAQLETEFHNATGTANEMRQVMDQGLPGAVAMFKSALEGLMLTIGEAGFTRVLTVVISLFTSFLSFIRGSPGPVQTFIVVLLLLGPVLLGIGAALQIAAFAIGGYTAAVGIARAATIAWNASTIRTRIGLLALSAQMLIMRGVSLAWAAVTGIVTVAQWALNVALTANPIGIIIVAVAALIAGMIALGVLIWKFRDRLLDIGLVALAVLAPFIGVPLLIIRNWRRIVDFFDNLSLFKAGRAFIQTFIDGILSVGEGIKDAVSNVLGKARDLLPFSDAKRGPLSNLTASGRALVDTLRRGISQARPLGDALRAALPNLGGALPVGPLPAGAGAAGAGAGGGVGGGGFTLNLTIEKVEIVAPGGDPQAINDGLTDVLKKVAKRVVEEFDSQIVA